MKIPKTLIVLTGAAFAFCKMAHGAALVTVAVSTDTRSLQDINGVALSGGSPTITGDGVAVQIGYYQGATSGSIFFGNGDENTFISLIGTGSVLGLGLTLGDTSANGAANGEIFADVDVTGANAAFPAAGVPLVMRFFSAATLSGSTRFEAISNLAWGWVNPVNLPSIARVDMNFDIPGMVAKSGANISAFGSPIRASSPNPLAVPEPTSLMLVSIVGLLASARRNRK